MSKIEDLINKYCPNGVEYKEIKDICVDSFWLMPQTPKFVESGIPYITSKNIKNKKINKINIKYISEQDYNNLKKNRNIKKNDILISMIGTIGETAIVKSDDLPFYGQNMYLLRLDFSKVNKDYFYYYFTLNKIKEKLIGEKNNGNQGYLKTCNIEKLRIPVPPLEVQDEIVNILDHFAELEAALEAELEARNKQYEYFREIIFTCKNKKKLKDVAEIYDSLHATPKYVKNGYPMVRVADIKFGYINITNTLKVSKEDYIKFIAKYKPIKNDIIISRVGSFGNICLVGNEEICLGQNTSIIHPKINAKYLYYYLSSNNVQCWIKNNVKGAGYKSLSLASIMNIPISIPSLEEQQKIVDTLDKFDKLINDINEGIPAEINLRKKQYEYYRNKLLSFREHVNGQ